MVGKVEIFFIDLMVKTIVDYLKRPCTTCLLLQLLKEVFCKRSPVKRLNKILEKYLRKTLFLVKSQVLKMNLFTHIFLGFC